MSGKIWRYDVVGREWDTQKREDGDWVLYEDHAAQLAAAVERAEQAERERDALNKRLKDAGVAARGLIDTAYALGNSGTKELAADNARLREELNAILLIPSRGHSASSRLQFTDDVRARFPQIRAVLAQAADAKQKGGEA